MKFIQPRLRAAAGKHTLARSTRKQVTQKEREDLKKQVYDMICKSGPLSPKEIYEPLKRKFWIVRTTLDQLLKEKKIEKIGQRRGTKYKRR